MQSAVAGCNAVPSFHYVFLVKERGAIVTGSSLSQNFIGRRQASTSISADVDVAKVGAPFTVEVGE